VIFGLFFLFIASLPLLLFVVVVPRCCVSTVFLFALWVSRSWLCDGLGSDGEVDAASFRPAL
jgi:hypothetical protein